RPGRGLGLCIYLPWSVGSPTLERISGNPVAVNDSASFACRSRSKTRLSACQVLPARITIDAPEGTGTGIVLVRNPLLQDASMPLSCSGWYAIWLTLNLFSAGPAAEEK